MRIVVLDAEASDQGDIDWSPLAQFGDYRAVTNEMFRHIIY